MSVLDLNKLFPPDANGVSSPLPKQTEFLQAVLDPTGPKFVAYYGGYGCLAGSTLIRTLNGNKRLDSLTLEDRVLTSSGVYAQASVPFPKGKARLYRVRHAQGEFVAYESHLVYVAPGKYCETLALRPGDLLHISPKGYTPSLEHVPLASYSNACRLFQRAAGFLEHCVACYHQYGQLPQEVLDNARVLVPLLIDVLKCNLSVSQKDALPALELGNIRLDLLCGLLDRLRSFRPKDHPAGVWVDYIAASIFEQTSDVDLKLQQSLLKTALHHIGQLLPDDCAVVASPSSYYSPIISVEQLPDEEWYYDLEVLGIGHYLDADGVTHHNSGKSIVLCVAIITQAVLHGGEYVIARHFMPELRRTTMKTFVEMLPPGLMIEHRVADAEVHMKSTKGKAIIYFVGLDDPGKLDSLNLSGFALDEASQIPEEAFLKLQGRIRHPKGLRKGILVGNPKGHDWVYRKFVSKADIHPSKHSMYKMIVAPSTENIHLPPDYVENMLSTYSKERVQRDVMGSFDSFEGQVYNEFNRNVHIIPRFDIPSGWMRVVGADHGYRNPACWLWGAVDYDGVIYIYREYYESEKIIKDICKDVIGLNRGEKLEAVYIDPSTRAVKGQMGISDYAEYVKHLGKINLQPAKNDVEAGIDRVKSYLKIDPKIGKPKLYIFEGCVNTIEEMSKYRYEELSPQSEGKMNPKETPRKVDDHAMDALKYLILSHFGTPKEVDARLADYNVGGMEQALRREFYEKKHKKASSGFDVY